MVIFLEVFYTGNSGLSSLPAAPGPIVDPHAFPVRIQTDCPLIFGLEDPGSMFM